MDIVFHMVIPAMLAIIAGVSVKKALLLAPIAVIPDLDTAFNAHRLYLHTIFIPIAIMAVAWVYTRKRGWKPYGEILFLASLFYLSHLMLDFFGGPVGILWPLTNMGYGVNVGLNVTQQSIVPLSTVKVQFIQQEISYPNAIIDVAAASTQSVAVTIMLFAALVFSKFRIRTSVKKEDNHTDESSKSARTNMNLTQNKTNGAYSEDN